MLGIAQDQLESVLAGRQLDTCLGLACSEMKMGLVLWDRFVRIEWFVHVNQQMMMAAVLKIVACVRDTHVAQAEATPKSAFDHGAVLRPNEIQNRILCRGLSLSVGSARHSRKPLRLYDTLRIPQPLWSCTP